MGRSRILFGVGGVNKGSDGREITQSLTIFSKAQAFAWFGFSPLIKKFPLCIFKITDN
jgi:hypothetical protein